MKLNPFILCVLASLLSLQMSAQSPKIVKKQEVDTTVQAMVESFKKLLIGERKEYLSDSIVTNAVFRWLQIGEKKVHYTKDENRQTEKHLTSIDKRFSDKKERVGRYVKLFQYKIDQQLQEEAHENLGKDVSPKEAFKMIVEENLLSDIAVINEVYLGKSDYIVIFISQRHGSKTSCEDVQNQIYTIKKRLAEKGVGVFVLEGINQKEFDDQSQLVFSNEKFSDSLYVDSVGYELTAAMKFETEFGTQVLSMGMEDFLLRKASRLATKAWSSCFSDSPDYEVKSDAFQQKTLNVRNRVAMDYIKKIVENARKSTVVFQIGALHFENIPFHYVRHEKKHLQRKISLLGYSTPQKVSKLKAKIEAWNQFVDLQNHLDDVKRKTPQNPKEIAGVEEKMLLLKKGLLKEGLKKIDKKTETLQEIAKKSDISFIHVFPRTFQMKAFRK